MREHAKSLQNEEIRLAKLKERIAGADRDGLGTKVATLEAEVSQAKRDVARLTAKVEALQLLDRMLEEAEEQTRDHIVRPVAVRVAPYLQHVFPGSQLNFGEGFEFAILSDRVRVRPCMTLVMERKNSLEFLFD